MKKLLLSAVALAALMSAPIAMADDQNGSQPRQERADRADKGDKPDSGMQGSGNMAGPKGDTQDGDRGNGRDNANNGNRDNNADDRNNGRDKKVVVRKAVDRNVILKFRANITAPHKFHFARAYVRPPGWYPHRWVFGERLPRNFFVRDFWILDFTAYGLLEPWDGYEWVRYGDDALLIDVDTGEVIRVEYDVFY